MPDFEYPNAPVYIYEIPMGVIPSNIGQGPVVPITVALEASVDPYLLSELGVPPDTDVTVQIFGTGGGGGGAAMGGTAGGGGGGSPAGVIFRVPSATWAVDGTLLLPFGGVGGGTGGNGETGEVTVFEIGANSVEVGGGGGGIAASGAAGAGGAVTFDAPDFDLAVARPGSSGQPNSGLAGGAGGVFAWGGQGGVGGTGGGAASGNGSDARAIIQFTPGA